MSTPFGKRGWYWREWSEGKTWERTEIDATKVPRISKEFLEEERQAMGSFWFDQEYLCQFKESTDTFFPYDLVEAALRDDIKPLYEVRNG
jgi:phage FluMu gp28-like protein